MNLYGADHHLLVLSDAIEADEHRHSFVQVTVALEGAFEIQIGGRAWRRLESLSIPTCGIVWTARGDRSCCCSWTELPLWPRALSE